MLLRLQADGVAHGDLQHGNVLVTLTESGMPRLRLVDYDTVFVPDLVGRPLVTAGLPGYTHPNYLAGQKRTYGREMDTFSGLVILLSLWALAHDPSLHGRFSHENLLLSDADLEHPHRSPAFLALLAMQDAVVPFLASTLEAMCQNARISEVLLVSIIDQDKTPDELKARCVSYEESLLNADNNCSTVAPARASHTPWTDLQAARRLSRILILLTLLIALAVLLALYFIGRHIEIWRQHITLIWTVTNVAELRWMLSRGCGLVI